MNTGTNSRIPEVSEITLRDFDLDGDDLEWLVDQLLRDLNMAKETPNIIWVKEFL